MGAGGRPGCVRCAGLALLGVTVAMTVASSVVVLLHLGDDGGALVAEAGRPSAQQCLHSLMRCVARSRPRRCFDSPPARP